MQNIHIYIDTKHTYTHKHTETETHGEIAMFAQWRNEITRICINCNNAKRKPHSVLAKE